MTDPVSAIGLAWSSAKRLREISKNIAEAEFKNALADLIVELADAKVEVAEMKSQLAAQADEIRRLKAADPSEKEVPMGVKFGCYQFEGDEESLYCTACYDSKGVKSLTTRMASRRRQCPVCKAFMGR